MPMFAIFDPSQVTAMTLLASASSFHASMQLMNNPNNGKYDTSRGVSGARLRPLAKSKIAFTHAYPCCEHASTLRTNANLCASTRAHAHMLYAHAHANCLV